MEKTGDISSATPQPGEKTEKRATAAPTVKENPTSKQQADKIESNPMTRASDAVSNAAKKQ